MSIQYWGRSLACLTLVSALWVSSAPRCVAADRDAPNIVLIMTDNHGAWSLGCYGNPDIRTPNIDRLADEGMLFTRCYANNAVCSPTRASFLTGLMPCQHGVHRYLGAGGAQIGPKAYDTLAEFDTLPKLLHDAGYEFENVRSIRTDRWKYIERYGQEPNELYDLQADPAELNNLIDQPEQGAMRTQLAQRMHAWFDRVADPKWDLWKGGTSKTGLMMKSVFEHPGPTFRE